MLLRALHRLVAIPAIYDFLQETAGTGAIRRRIAPHAAQLPHARNVLDLGGGTGLFRSIWPSHVRYVCLDLDPQKLRGLRTKFPDAAAVLADASLAPIASAALDAVICTLVSHHLQDAALDRVLAEAARLLEPHNGRFLLVDALWDPSRPVGRLLWKYDRGSHPRALPALRAAIDRHFHVIHQEQFCLWHRYVTFVAVPKS